MDFDKAYNTINSIKQKAHSDKKITESVDHSVFNSIRNDHIIDQSKAALVKPTTLSQLINQVDFIPFLQERDGLGKLIVNNFNDVRPVKIIKMRKNKKILDAALSEFATSVEKKGSLTNLILENVNISDTLSNNMDGAGDLPRSSSHNVRGSSKDPTVFEIRKLAAKGIRNSIVSSSISLNSGKKKGNIGYDRFEYNSKLGSSDYSANTKWAEQGIGAMKYHDYSPEERNINSASSCFRSMSRENFYRKLKKETPEEENLKIPLKLRYELIDKKITKDFTIAKDHERAASNQEERVNFTNLSENFSRAFDLNKNPVDISKQLPRFQAVHKWAPAIYENDKEIKPEKQRGFKELNLKALEKEFEFQMNLQRKYFRKVTKPSLAYILNKKHYPANKEEFSEKLLKTTQRYALNPENMVNGDQKKFLKL